MSYENAPATTMLNTHCVCCSRPLVDALSVEIGIGPICREKHGYNAEVTTEESRGAANKIVARVARKGTTEQERREAFTALQALGFIRLASAVLYRGQAPTIKLRPSTKGTGFYVSAPYSASALNGYLGWRSIPGRRWSADTKENFIPHSSMDSLTLLIGEHYPGATVETVV